MLILTYSLFNQHRSKREERKRRRKRKNRKKSCTELFAYYR